MDRGWGLTLEKSDPVGFFGNKTVLGIDLSPRLNRRNKGLIMFPVNYSTGKEDTDAPSSSGGDQRLTLGEVDFFSEKKTSINDDNNNSFVKKEDSHSETINCKESNVNTGLQLVTANTGSDRSSVDDGLYSDAEDKRAKNEVIQLQVELERLNGENQRLRGILTQVSSNCTSLQMHLVALMQQQQNPLNQKTRETEINVDQKSEEEKRGIGESVIVPRQFLDLSPGAVKKMADVQSNSLSEEKTVSGSPQNNLELSRNKRIGREKSPDSEGWAPNKAPKLNNSKPVDQSNDATMRKARVSVRARSEAPMISDGCQWRKYGQKMAKGNPCPRAYYRCTMAVGCPVRKQVQRCADDRTVLITTYEGTHSHPLPPAAMAMASTTSAAANMLLSGSMPSSDVLMHPNFLARNMVPCSSNMATISASAPFPTITLDLTQTPNPLQFHRPPQAHAQFQVPFPVPPQNFSPLSTPTIPQIFGQVLYNQSKFSGLQMSKDVNEAAQVFLQHPQLHQAQQQQHPLFSDTLSAATAAITADPNFTAALAAAISTIMDGSHPNNSNSNTTPKANPTNGNVNTSSSNKTNNLQLNQ